MRFKPGLTIAPEEVTVVTEEGKFARGINWQLSEEEFHQVESGYRCLNCMEPFSSAFPEKCPLCGFHVRAQQTFELQRQHQGEERYGYSPEYERLEEEREREAFKPRSGIWLPGDPV